MLAQLARTRVQTKETPPARCFAACSNIMSQKKFLPHFIVSSGSSAPKICSWIGNWLRLESGICRNMNLCRGSTNGEFWSMTSSSVLRCLELLNWRILSGLSNLTREIRFIIHRGNWLCCCGFPANHNIHGSLIFI